MERAETMVRAQILLTPTQRRRLEQIAQREKRSLSEITRRALQLGLDILERQGETWEQQRRTALADLGELRRKIEDEHGIYPGDPIGEVRAARQQDTERVWQKM